MLKSVKFFKVSPLRKQFKSLSTLSKNSIQIILSEEVRYGIENFLPIVALESTIITHGMPYPRNIESALEVEEEIRKKDVIPATVAVIRGQIKAGLSEVEISELGDTKSSQAIKTSRRDLAYIISNKLNGGTTVSATLIIARKAGIPIFATGGLGGVHREGEKTLDVSADLTELGRTSVAVFSSGIKSILDIPKTLEYLETQGVFVATFGDTKDFPGFYCSKSGYTVPYNVNNAKEAACIIKHNRELCLDSGMLFGIPVPEEYSLNKEELDEIIKNGLTSAKRRGVIGKELTPFLLSWVAEATQGKSLTTNVALVKNNARIAADVAVELSQMRGRTGSKPVMATGNEDNERNLEKRPVVIGGCVLDRCAILDETDIKLDGRIHYAKFTESPGGVARNIADALCKLNCPPVFLSAVGKDASSRIVTSELPWKTIKYLRRLSNFSTAQCAVIFDAKRECRLLIGDMEIHKEITPDFIWKNEDIIKNAPLLILDANPTIEAIATILEIANKHDVPVFFEPTDVVISKKPFQVTHWRTIKYISPNITELKHIAKALGITITWENCKTEIEEIVYISKLLVKYIDNIIVTLGANGLLVARYGDSTSSLLSGPKTKKLQIRHYTVPSVQNLINVSGAGDCLVSGMISSMLKGLNEEECVNIGLQAALSSLQSYSAVPKEFKIDNVKKFPTAKYFTIV